MIAIAELFMCIWAAFYFINGIASLIILLLLKKAERDKKAT